MTAMTTYERMKRMYEHREADRVPIIDAPWESTIERWQREGMPADVSFIDYFDLDKFAHIDVDSSPRYEERIVEETPEYTTRTTRWGATLSNWRHAGGVPEFLDFKIVDAKSWEEAKARMQPTPDRINWDHLKRNYAKWRQEGRWIIGGFWFGFDVTHSWTVGTERVLIAMAEQPEWIADIFNHFLDMDLALFDLIWKEGYRCDEIMWYDDMGYKNAQFFSLNMYRNMVKPAHQRAAAWAHERGMKVHLH